MDNRENKNNSRPYDNSNSPGRLQYEKKGEDWNCWGMKLLCTVAVQDLQNFT